MGKLILEVNDCFFDKELIKKNIRTINQIEKLKGEEFDKRYFELIGRERSIFRQLFGNRAVGYLETCSESASPFGMFNIKFKEDRKKVEDK